MVNKDYLDTCRVSTTETSKMLIIRAIHNYINMHPQLLPMKSGRDILLNNFLHDNKLQLLDEQYFTPSKLNYTWDKAFFIVYNTENKTKTILIKNGEKYSCISTRYSLTTLRCAYKLIVKDLYYQYFFLKCKKNIDFFIEKMKKTTFFVKENDKYIKTTNIIYKEGVAEINSSFVHQYVIVKYNTLSKQWGYEHGQKVLYGLGQIIGYIKDYMNKIHKYDKFTNEDIISLMNEKIEFNVSEMKKNVNEVAKSVCE